MKTMTNQLVALVAQSGSSLTHVVGVGSVVTAKIIGHTGDVARFPDTHHYASFNGTAPMDASSGEHSRHRLGRRGDRQLNAATDVVAIYQFSLPGPRREHHLMKLAESRTVKEPGEPSNGGWRPDGHPARRLPA